MTLYDAAMGEIVASVRVRPAPNGVAVKIIAVDGHGAAGKSTLAGRLAEALGGAPVIHTDDFASADVPRDWWPRLVAETLEPLAANQPARFTRTDWERTGRGQTVVIEPADFVILEGVSASREAFRPYLTYSIWIETPRELRLARGLARDGEDARAQWEQWMAEEDDYVAREQPRERADLVVRGEA